MDNLTSARYDPAVKDESHAQSNKIVLELWLIREASSRITANEHYGSKKKTYTTVSIKHLRTGLGQNMSTITIYIISVSALLALNDNLQNCYAMK